MANSTSGIRWPMPGVATIATSGVGVCGVVSMVGLGALGVRDVESEAVRG